MKIGSVSTKEMYRCYSEARGIAQNKRSVLRRKSSKTFTFLQTSIINTILLFVVLLCIVCYYDLSFWFLTLAFLPIVVSHIYVLYYFKKIKKRRKSTYNVFDENGVNDQSFYGIKMIFPWKKIKAVVIGKYSIVVLTDTPCYFYYGIEEKDDVEEAIDLYSKKKKLIY